MPARLRLSALFGAALVLSSCVEKPRPAWPGGKPEVDTIKVREGVVTVPAAVTNKTRVSKNALTFPAEMAGEVMANWPQGKVIVGSPATDMEARRNNPFGFLRKVKSTRVEGSSVIVETENASLDEAITGQYRKETDLGALPALELPEGTDLSAYDVPVRLGRGQPFPEGQDSDAGIATNQQPLNDPAHDGPTVFGKQVQPLNITNQAFEVSAPNLTLLDVTRPVRIPNAPGEPLDVSARIVVNPAVRFQPRIVIDYDSQLLPYPALNSFEFLVGGNLNVSSSLEVQVAARRPAGMTVQQQTAILAWLRVNALQYTFEKEIGRPRVVPFNLGPVPMVSTTKAFLQCEAKLSGAAHVKGSLAQNVNLTFGVKWRRGNGWATDFSYPNQTPAVTGQVISGEAEVELDCGIILRTDAYAGGVAGPYAQARADVVGTAAVKEECPAPADERSARNHPADVKVDLGIKAYAALQVGVDSINFLKLLTLEYGPYDIVRKNWNEGSQVMVPNPLYVPGCGAAWCSTPEVPAREHLPIRSWTFTKPNGGLGSPDAGVWCVVPCDDGRKNGMEADVDCGGAGVCARCTRDQTCTTGADCLSGVCGGNGRCVASLCEDGVKGQQETDVDCGGPTCPACQFLTEPGPQCAADSDCAGSFCSNDGVAPKRCTRDLCRDGRVTGTESDVDCGASEGCQGCSVGKRCTGPSDCASGACHATTGLCVANTCVDGARTGDESDVDCGGSCPTKCALNQQCNFTQRGNADCASNVCSTPPFSGAPGRCVATTCENLRGDADEIGVDCSGACAARCPVGQTCRFGQNDCVTAAVCSATTRRCEPPGCGDGVLNGQESSIDCGGPTCLKCALSKACNANSDCTSSVCSGGRCVGSVCENGVKDATEADVDCGGSCTLACATGSTCSQPRDCASNLCVSGRCISDACQDRVRNGAEADVDCGGATCTARCAGGKRCLVNGDCQSNLCNTTAQRCVAGPCDDGLLTAGSESDVDCGGSCGAMNPAKRCTVNQRCTAAADCASGVCNATTQRCVSDACFDGVRNGTETDLDCGGSCDPKCAAGRLCTVATDCQSGSCTAMGRCATDQCSDGRVNGNETGLDCGGQCATRCPVGQGCLTGADCAHPMGLQGVNGFCSTATATCTNSSCTTGVKDGDETGVDCGGSCAARCPVGQGCTTNADCAGNLCNTTTRLCVASRCENGLKDQDETDIDCGGDTCNGCNVGQACTLGRHCATQYCGTTNLCIPSVPRTCSDAFVRTASATSGMYLIDPDGPQTRFSTGGWRQPMSTYCLMQNDPNGILTGGWTPVMYANSFWSTSEPRLYGYFRNSQDVSNREACSTSNPTCSFSTAGNTCQNDVGGGPCTNANTGCHCTSAAPWSVQYAPSLHGNPVNFSGSSVAVEDALAFNLAVNGGVGQYQVTDGIPATHFRWQVFRGGALIFDSGIFSMAPPVLPGTPLPWFANGQWGLNSFFGGSPWDYCAQTTSLAAESYPSGQSGLVGLPFNNDPVGYAARDGWCRRFGRNMSRSIGQPFSSLPADVTLGWVHRLLPRGVNGQTTSQTAPWVGLWLGNYGHAPGSPRNWVPDVANSANGAQPPPQNNTLGICNGLVFGTDDTSRATECTAYAHVTGTSFSYGAGETTDITKGSQFSAGVPGLVFVLWAR